MLLIEKNIYFCSVFKINPSKDAISEIQIPTFSWERDGTSHHHGGSSLTRCYSHKPSLLWRPWWDSRVECDLICLGCYDTSTRLVAFKQQKFTSHSSGGCKPKMRAPAAWSQVQARCLAHGRHLPTVSSCGRRRRGSLRSLRALIPFTRAPPSWPLHSQRPLPNTIPLEVWTLTYEF